VISRVAVEAILLLLAWVGVLMVRPWRLLKPHDGQVRLATPLLASVTLLPWLWSWPGLAALPFPLHWSGAPLATLLLGWPLAIPVVTLAGLSTLVTTGATPAHALELTVWSGVLPATLMLLLGHAVRRALGPNPVVYMLGRAFFVPILALGGCALLAASMGHALAGVSGELQRVAIALLAIGEGSWTCAVVSLLVASRPQWLATWSDPLNLVRQPPRPARIRPHR
jgi:uncharacterized membrane protein